MTYGLVIIVLIVVLAVAAAVFFSGGLGKSVAAGKVDPHEEAEKAPHVRYLVPDGQDPAVVLAALKEAGYDAVPDKGSYEQVVVVPLPVNTVEAREGVRTVIGSARATNMDGPPVVDPQHVRFVGEDATP